MPRSRRSVNVRTADGYRLNGDYLEPDPAEAPLVTTIFDRYTRRRMGTQAIASWLNERGHRTRAGRGSVSSSGVTTSA